MRCLLIFVLLVFSNHFTCAALSFDELLQISRKYENKYLKKFKGLECYEKTNKYRILICFHLDLKTGNKEVFTKDFFLENLSYSIRKRRSKIPWMRYDIYKESDKSESQKIIAWGDSYSDVIACNYNTLYQDVQKFVIKHGFDIFFTINQIGFVYFGIKDGEIYVITKEKNNDDYSISPLDSFVRKNWDILYQNSFDSLKGDYYLSKY